MPRGYDSRMDEVKSMTVQCCVCRKIRVGKDRWVLGEIPAEDRMNVSHGYCPACAAKAFAEVRRALSQSPVIQPPKLAPKVKGEPARAL